MPIVLNGKPLGDILAERVTTTEDPAAVLGESSWVLCSGDSLSKNVAKWLAIQHNASKSHDLP